MKQFIYLDTDTVNSIIAQQENGLVLNTVSEQEDAKESEKAVKGALTAMGAASGGLWKFAQVQANLSLTGELLKSDHSQSVLKEIATKTLHDAAFDIAFEYLNRFDMTPENADFGNYIILTKPFDFIDFEYIETLFMKDGLINFIKKTRKDVIDKGGTSPLDSLSREQKRMYQVNIMKEISKQKIASDKEFDDIADIVKILRQIIPYNRMLFSPDGYLIPLEDEYFRDNPKTIGFKHGGNITCVGCITNVIGESCDSSAYNAFSSIQVLVNQALVTLLSSKEKDLFVIHPIAVYYGN